MADCVALAGGAWSELGVSGWTTTHRRWAIDPEPLILFTAWLGDADARLRDEAVDWCIRYERRISRVRLKNLLREEPDEVQEAFGEFAATVSEHIRTPDWPGVTSARRYRPTGRSALPPLENPSLVWLRMRALFGLGARTEILRVFVTETDANMSAYALSKATGYAKRNVAEECESLEQAGLLRSRPVGNRFVYSMARASELKQFLGSFPAVRPRWSAVFTVARTIAELDQAKATSSARVYPVTAKRGLRAIESALLDVDAESVPEGASADRMATIVARLRRQTLSRWAKGQWTADVR